MNLDDYISDEARDERDRTDYSDYDEELADVIDERVENDSWRTNICQCYYVTTVVEETLERLPRTPSQRRQKVRGVRGDVQEDVADDVGIDWRSVQAHCHSELFEGYENPPQSYGSKSEWFRLFDQLIQEIDRTWYQDEAT